MTRLAVLAALSLVLAIAPALAQTDDDTPIRAGARALLFQVGPDLTLSGFDGAALSLRWHGSATRATRVGLTLNARAEGGDDVDEQFAALGVNAVFLTYRRSRTPVYLYHGFGPTGSVSLVRREFRDQEQGFVRASAGVLAVVGVEVPVTSAVSLSGEYGLSLEGTYQHQERGPDGDDVTLLGVALGSRGARAGLSVYF